MMYGTRASPGDLISVVGDRSMMWATLEDADPANGRSRPIHTWISDAVGIVIAIGELPRMQALSQAYYFCLIGERIGWIHYANLKLWVHGV